MSSFKICILIIDIYTEVLILYTEVLILNIHKELFSDLKILLSVCESPTHIDAREKMFNTSWIESNVILIHDASPITKQHPNSINLNPNWAYGVSKNFG